MSDPAKIAMLVAGSALGALQAYFCPNDGGGQNYTGFCSPQVDALFKKGNTTPSPAARVKAYNAADVVLSNVIPTIPLYQKPTFLVYHNYVKGMTDNVLSAGPRWNAENWWLNKWKSKTLVSAGLPRRGREPQRPGADYLRGSLSGSGHRTHVDRRRRPGSGAVLLVDIADLKARVGSEHMPLARQQPARRSY